MLSLLVSGCFQLRAQECGCDIVKNPSPNQGIALNGIAAGSVVCLKAGHYYQVFIGQNTGTAANPIIIKNCGGAVTVGNSNLNNSPIKLNNSTHVKLLGNGDAAHEYGIKIVVSKDGFSGLKIEGKSSDLEIAHLEIANTGFAGIQENSGGQGGFINKNMTVHDNYIHNTGGEGMYLGQTDPAKTATEFTNISIYDNRLEDTGWDGMQVGRAQGARVYQNVIRRTGVKTTNNVQRKGLQIGEGTSGDFYRNWIEDPGAGGLIILGNDVKFYNNVLIGGGVFCTEPLPGFQYTRFLLANNTFYRTNGTVYETRNGKVQNLLINNLAYNNTSADNLIATLNNGNSTNPQPTITATTNLLVKDASLLGIQNASANDFRPTAASSAVDAGTNVSPYGIVVDYQGTPRPQGSAYDIGAYEFQGSSTPVSLWREAECASVGSNWQTNADPQASNGQYLVYPQGLARDVPPSNPADQVTFAVNVPQAASYYLLARIKAQDLSTNSFWVRVDNQPWIEWWEGMTLSPQFAWNLAPGGAFALAAGNHTVTFAYREDGTQLDKLALSTSSTLPSGPGGSAPACAAPGPVVTANAGDDRRVSANASVTLSGFGRGPNPFRGYLWQKLSGPSVTLTDANTANVVLTNLQVGTYRFRFTATDSEGNSGSDEMTLTVTGSSARTMAETSPDERLPSDVRWSVYPNPTHQQLVVHTPPSDQTGVLLLTTVSGRAVRRVVVPPGQDHHRLNVADLPGGVYLLRWQADHLRTTRIFIEH